MFLQHMTFRVSFTEILHQDPESQVCFMKGKAAQELLIASSIINIVHPHATGVKQKYWTAQKNVKKNKHKKMHKSVTVKSGVCRNHSADIPGKHADWQTEISHPSSALHLELDRDAKFGNL